jgi:transposase
MPTRNNRSFSEEFKAEAVRLVLVGRRSAHDVAKSLGMNPSTLMYWLKTHRREAAAATSAVELELRKHVEELQAKLQRVEAERDLLKKAAVYFAKEHP